MHEDAFTTTWNKIEVCAREWQGCTLTRRSVGPLSCDSLTGTRIPRIPGVCWPLVAGDAVRYSMDFYKLQTRGGFGVEVRVTTNNSSYWPSFKIGEKTWTCNFFPVLYFLGKKEQWLAKSSPDLSGQRLSNSRPTAPYKIQLFAQDLVL